MTPHKETTKEPIRKIIVWPTMHEQWANNSTWQINFTAFDVGSELYDQLDVESSIFLGGQEYIVKNCVENYDTSTKEITAWHVYNEIERIYVRADLSKELTVTSNNSNDTDSSNGNTDDTNQQQQDQKPEQPKNYKLEDILKLYLGNNDLGFKYEIHGDFPEAPCDGIESGSGKEMLEKICKAWPNAIVNPDNKNIRVYSDDQFFKDEGRVLDLPNNLKSMKTTRDSTTIVNQIRCVGAKHNVDVSMGSGSGAGGNLDNVEGFAKSPINADFGVNKQAMLQSFAAQDRRVHAWGVDVNRLYDTVKAQGISPEWFFAYDITEQDPMSWSWLNHFAYRLPDPYQDAIHVCDWIKQFANSDSFNPATGFGAYTSPQMAAQWNQEFHKGTIGRLYLQGTAAAVMELANENPGRYGRPMNWCVQLIKSWGGHTNSGGGSWGWPFANIPRDGQPTVYLNGQQYGHTGYGRGDGDFHDGFDFDGAHYTGNVLSIHPGTVHKIGADLGWWYIWIQSSDGYNIVYQEGFGGGDIFVHEGQQVQTGTPIARVTGSHTHVGISKKAIPIAYYHGYNDDGTWLDPIATIKAGIAGGGSDGNGGGSVSAEEYYFQPFILQDDNSIKEWGVHPGPDLVDERFTDPEAMRKYALTTLKPNPSLTIEVTLKDNSFQPKKGEILRVQARQKKYSGSWRTVGYDVYPEPGASEGTQITLNDAKQTILDYQNQRTTIIQQALNEQKQRLQGVTSTLDRQSQTLTQVVNNKNEDNHNAKVTEAPDLTQDGMNELKKLTTGGANSDR